MELPARDLWTVVHGVVLGGIFLMAFAGGLTALWSLRPELITVSGIPSRMRLLIGCAWTMAIAAWLTAIVGTYIVYPWYRAEPPKGATGSALENYPTSSVLPNERTKDWHRFGMEWKEHVGWFAPILSTAIAFVATRYRKGLVNEPKLRQMLFVLYSAVFFVAAVAGVLGTLIDSAVTQ